MKTRHVKRVDGYLRFPAGEFQPLMRLCMIAKEQPQNPTNVFESNNVWVSAEPVTVENKICDMSDVFYVLLPYEKVTTKNENGDLILNSDKWMGCWMDKLIPVYIEKCGRTYAVVGFKGIKRNREIQYDFSEDYFD